ncbi:UNVERIFIED_CONTAM: hypothetical protein GTU68_013255 [Idotea baltica]|nr:hypothetical protein [Idotea baltica]
MTDEELLQIYGLYKQATCGDNNTDKPGMLDFKGKKKYESWSDNKGMSKEEAQTKYVNLAVGLLTKYNVQVPEALR